METMAENEISLESLLLGPLWWVANGQAWEFKCINLSNIILDIQFKLSECETLTSIE